jgi:hypothetical protein
MVMRVEDPPAAERVTTKLEQGLPPPWAPMEALRAKVKTNALLDDSPPACDADHVCAMTVTESTWSWPM